MATTRNATPGHPDHDWAATVLTLVSISTLSIIAGYQAGIIARLPEPKSKLLQANRIHQSPLAYAHFGIPDAFLGLASYSTTLGLIQAVGLERPELRPWVRAGLGLKCAVDAGQAINLTQKSWKNFQAFSLYSLIIGTATLLVLPCVVPGAGASARKLFTARKN